MTNSRRIHPVLFVTMLALLFASMSQAMFARITTSAHPEARVTAKVDNAKRTVLHGHVSSALRTAIDMGRQDPRTPSPGMIMVLKSSEEQKREIRKVIDEQQDQRTANYHQWVTPEEFGEKFGVHDNDIAKVKEWLTSQGFTVDEVSKSKRVIKFSGNVGQVEKAFQTEMHLYTYRSEMHVANNREISVPEALNKVIGGVSLHNFYRKGSLNQSQIKNGGKVKFKGPKYTSSSSVHYVAPYDFATIYNTAPLLAAGINGTGSSIAVVGRSDIQMGDVTTYRQIFNLPPNDPTFIHAGQDNGTEPGDDSESDLDVEVSGGMAPNAKVYFVIGTPTFLVDGITNSVEYIVENNLADIMSISYGSCESVEGAGGNEFNNQAFEQAAAQGISVFIASGDNGPAGCDNQNNSLEVMGYATGAEGSTPYSVGVGGTELVGDAGAKFSQFWATTSNALYFTSALGYIPEYPWNDAKASTFTDVTGSGLAGLWSSSGGVSSYYLRPSWQQGPGINNASDPAFTQGGNWVASVTLTTPGTLYTGTTTTVTFSGGTCTTLPFAGATANISGGSVAATGGLAQINFNTSSTTVPAQGLNCTVAPNVTFGTTTGTVATGTVNLGPMQNTPFLVTGVPHRLTPDIALNASADHNGTLICIEGTCDNGSLNIEGGTSVAAPTMAGVQALINQANGGRQGMPAYIYYSLAQAQATANGGTAACNSGTTTVNPPLSSANCAFDDIQTGNTFICATSTCTTSSGVKIGWTAGAGYDLTTGLGSPNVANLAAQWKNVVFNSTTTTLNLSQTNFAHGTSITLSGTVAGSGTPTGDVAFIVSQGEIGIPINQGSGAFVAPGAFATLSGGSYSANLGALPAGTYNVTARYGGDQVFGSSMSAPVAVTVSGGESTTVTIAPALLDGSACTLTNINTFNYGQLMFSQITVAGASGQGIPTGSLAITVDGNPYTTVTLDPNGFGYLAAGAIPTSSCIYDYMFAQAPTLSGGVHSIGATYSGDGTFTGGTATPVSVTIAPLTVTPTLSVGSTTLNSGTPDPLVATFAVSALTGISPQSSGPTGTVTFFNGATSLGSASVVPAVAFVGNTYTFSATAAATTSLITATGSITAVYSGDANYAATTSTGTAVTVISGTSTSTAVTSNANPTTINGRPTFTATITGETGTAAGTVTFYDGTSILGTGTVATATHTASFRLASGQVFNGGTHNVTATFGGATTFSGSTSPVLVQTVTKGTIAFGLTGNKIVDAASNTFTFQAVLTPSPSSTGFPVNKGVATFFDGATPIGTSTPIIFTTAQGGENVWLAQVTGVTLTPGSHSITCSYTDVNYGPSTSAALTVIAAGGSVGIYSPIPGTTLGTSGTTTFKWFPVAGANYWLDIGPTQGSNNYYQSGNLSTALSQAVANNLFPVNGSTVWARVWTLINGTWGFSDVSYTASGAGTKGQITSPVPTSVLAGSTVTFNWSAGTNSTAYWIDAGSTVGGHDYFQSGNLGNVLTKIVTGLPMNGSTVYVTLYSLISGNWQNNQYTYTAAAAASGGVIQTPVPASTLTSNTVTFTWTAGAGATAYWLDAGNTPGGNQYYQSGNLGNVLTTTVSGLPTDGSGINVTLYSLIGGSWVPNAYTYTALNATGGLAVITSPTGPTLSGSSATFTWSADVNATSYWLDIGSTPGGNDVYQSGNLGNVTSTNVSSLPANGNTIYTTLYSLVGGQWLSTTASYTSNP